MGRGSGVGLVGQEVIGIDTLPNLMSAVCIVHNTCVMCPPTCADKSNYKRRKPTVWNGKGIGMGMGMEKEIEKGRKGVGSRQSDNEPQGLS